MLSRMGFQLSFLQNRLDTEQKDRPFVVVDEVTKARGIYDGEAKSDTILLDI